MYDSHALAQALSVDPMIHGIGGDYALVPANAVTLTVGGYPVIVEWVLPPSADQIAAAQAIANNFPVDLEAVKVNQIAIINDAMNAQLSLGVSAGGYTLVGGADGQNAMAQGLTALTAAIVAGIVVNSDNISKIFGRGIVDLASQEHDVTVQEYMQISFAYAAAIGAIQAKRDSLKGDIESATSVLGVLAVNWVS